jgi:predicted ATP-grasp superfamily ATP-dependent carboligase
VAAPARILVTDLQDRPGLAAARCLADGGYRVTGGALHRRSAGLSSRACADRRILPDPRDGLDAFVGGMSDLFADDPHDMVIGGRDETVYALSARREALAPFLPSHLPDHEVLLRAFDRTVLGQEAVKAGFAVPEQRVCASPQEAIAAADELGLPAIVKPIHTAFEVDGRVDRHASRWVEDAAVLAQAVEDMGICLVQQRITGEVVSLGGVAVGGRLLAAVASRYLRTWPPAGGHSSLSETIPVDAELEERVEALVCGIGWNGLFELELMRTAAGHLHPIDFNPRIYGSLALGRAAGAPLATVWCDTCLGLERMPLRARAGVRYRFDHGELYNFAWRLRRGDIRGAAGVLRPAGESVHSLVRLDDPLPALVSLTAFARRWRLRRG